MTPQQQQKLMELSLETSKNTLIALKLVNDQGAIADTIWLSKYETLFDYIESQIDAMQRILAQSKEPEQRNVSEHLEPVAWMVTTEMQDGTKKTYPLTGRFKDVNDICDFGNPVPLYITPPQHFLMAKHWKAEYDKLTAKQWVGLTYEEIIQIASTPDGTQATTKGYVIPFARAIEAKLKEKNT